MLARAFTGGTLSLALLAMAAGVGIACSSDPQGPVSTRGVATEEHTVFVPMVTVENESSSTPDTPVANTCIDSGDDADIMAALQEPGDEAVLCPGSLFELSNTIEFNAPDQKLYTQGKPQGDTRAVLSVAGNDVSTAVSSGNQPRAVLSHVEVDGNRDVLGGGPLGGLIEWGGNGADTLVEWVRAYEPRGWSVLVMGHGDDLMCQRSVARNNFLGPAGHHEYSFSDGISLACRNSIVEDNTIIDATDGGIVIFQAPGSLIRNNTIITEERIMFYGISMVDSGPYDGDFSGTRVIGNHLEARSSIMRYGIPMGPWIICVPEEEMIGPKSRGAVVNDNVLSGDFMGYGFSLSGVEDWTAIGNRDESNHLPGQPDDCFGETVDQPGSFQYMDGMADGDFQSEFEPAIFGWGGSQWPLHIAMDVACTEDRIGADMLARIRDGLEGPVWDALETAPGGQFVSECMKMFEPPTPPPGSEEIVVGASACGPGCVQVDLMNWTDERIDISAAEFIMADFWVDCPGLPDFIEAGEDVACHVTDYISDGWNVLGFVGMRGEHGGNLGFGYPFEEE